MSIRAHSKPIWFYVVWIQKRRRGRSAHAGRTLAWVSNPNLFVNSMELTGMVGFNSRAEHGEIVRVLYRFQRVFEAENKQRIARVGVGIAFFSRRLQAVS